jgi:hypothetical protein
MVATILLDSEVGSRRLSRWTAKRALPYSGRIRSGQGRRRHYLQLACEDDRSRGWPRGFLSVDLLRQRLTVESKLLLAIRVGTTVGIKIVLWQDQFEFDHKSSAVVTKLVNRNVDPLPGRSLQARRNLLIEVKACCVLSGREWTPRFGHYSTLPMASSCRGLDKPGVATSRTLPLDA